MHTVIFYISNQSVNYFLTRVSHSGEVSNLPDSTVLKLPIIMINEK